MEITEEHMDEKGKRNIKSSILKLFDVPLNISTTFRCSGFEYSEQISFRVKGDFGKEQRMNRLN